MYLHLFYGLLSVTLGVSIAFLFQKNRTLERSLSERTQDLVKRNVELQNEMAERTRAAECLQANEERLRAIFECEPDSVKVIAADLTIVDINPAGLQMLEVKTAEEIGGRKITEFLAAESVSDFMRLHEAVMAGESGIAEFEISGSEGVSRRVEAHACPIYLRGRTTIAMVTVLHDVTRRRRMEAELAYQRDLLQTLMENTSDQIYFKDLNSRFIKVSRALVDRFGAKSSEELIGKCDFDLFADCHAVNAFEDEQRIIKTGESVIGKIEREVSLKDPNFVTWALTSKTPFRDRAGKIIGTFGVTKDITGMKETELKVEALHKQLLEISHQAGMAEVATSVLHNVGNVLNSVNVSCSTLDSIVRRSKVKVVSQIAQLLQENAQDLGRFFKEDPRGQGMTLFVQSLALKLGEEQKGFLKEIGRLNEYVNHIKEVVAMQQNYGKISGVKEIVKPVDLVEDSLRMNAGLLSWREGEVLREFDPVPAITIEKHKVLQILVNLIRNAKSACDESCRSDKRVIVRVSTVKERLCLSVVDNGIGIPRENLTRIFNHGFTTRKNGHGFGLHSAALAAQELGGLLTVQSNGPGSGAAFTLELPLFPSEAN